MWSGIPRGVRWCACPEGSLSEPTTARDCPCACSGMRTWRDSAGPWQSSSGSGGAWILSLSSQRRMMAGDGGIFWNAIQDSPAAWHFPQWQAMIWWRITWTALWAGLWSPWGRSKSSILPGGTGSIGWIWRTREEEGWEKKWKIPYWWPGRLCRHWRSMWRC